METPADRILKIIQDKGIKQRFIAKKIGMKPQTLNSKLRKYSKFTPDEIELICGVLGCQANDILKPRQIDDWEGHRK